MFGDYIGVYHTSWEVVWGMKPWLTLHSREQWRPLLENWNASTRKMKEYPAFRYYTNGYYVPLDTMAKLDENDELLGKKPLFFLHDQALVNATAPEALDGKTEILAYTPNRAVVRTTTAQDGFLCFLDNYEKFWTATLDGAPIDIARANFSFKAIPLPKGTHTVEWVYNPYPVKIVYILYYTLFGLFIAWCAVMFREKSWEWGPVPPRV
jgi:hypothetical protein